MDLLLFISLITGIHDKLTMTTHNLASVFFLLVYRLLSVLVSVICPAPLRTCPFPRTLVSFFFLLHHAYLGGSWLA